MNSDASRLALHRGRWSSRVKIGRIGATVGTVLALAWVNAAPAGAGTPLRLSAEGVYVPSCEFATQD